MKKTLIVGVLGLFLIGMASCGNRGHLCPAYGGQKDMTKKVDKTKKLQIFKKSTKKH